MNSRKNTLLSHLRLARYVALLLAAFVASAAARGDGPGAGKPAAVPFSRYVPASTKVFVTIRQLDEANDALIRAHAWRLLPLLSGTARGGAQAFDLRRLVTGFLGLRDHRETDAVLQSEIGFVVPSWSALGNALWFVRVTDEAALHRLFPPMRGTIGTGADASPCFRTVHGMSVCYQDGIASVARRAGPGSPFDETMNLMVGSDEDPLEQSAAFRELALYLPSNHLAVAYLARDETSSTEDSLRTAPWWPAVNRMVAGLYEGQGRLDVAIRASLAAPYRKVKLAQEALDRLVQLPSTTLFASATTIDLDRAYKAATTDSPVGTLGRYLALMAQMRAGSAGQAEGPSQLGPHVLLAWGQGPGNGNATPQIAVMIECADGRSVRNQAREISDRVIRLLEALEPTVTDKGLEIQTTRHLGAVISHVPLETYAQKSRHPFVRLLPNIEPAWTVWNGWLILALSRDHIERILDAQLGLAPSLATVPDVQALRTGPADRSVLSIVQADLAADVLDQWLAALDAGDPSLLNPAWWEERGGGRRAQPRLGIGMAVVQEPGGVVVARVYPQTAAQGRLQPGDRILGIDGKLLSLSSPNTDLRAGWAQSTADPGPTVRVERDGIAMDVVLPKKKPEAAPSTLRMNPADAVRELASLARTLQFASFAVLSSDEQHYSARLSLRFSAKRYSKSRGMKPSVRRAGGTKETTAK